MKWALLVHPKMPLMRPPTPSHPSCMWSSCSTKAPPQIYGEFFGQLGNSRRAANREAPRGPGRWGRGRSHWSTIQRSSALLGFVCQTPHSHSPAAWNPFTSSYSNFAKSAVRWNLTVSWTNLSLADSQSSSSICGSSVKWFWSGRDEAAVALLLRCVVPIDIKKNDAWW